MSALNKAFPPSAILVLLVVVAAPCAEGAGFHKAPSYSVAGGETTSGDFYVIANNITIAGRHEGDLVGWTQAAIISGEITGDLMLGAQTMDISGTVSDTVRFCGQSLSITGLVEGDVLFFGAFLSVHPTARVTGSVTAFAGTVTIDGTVDGDLNFKGGEVSVGGTIGRDADVSADALEFHGDGRIGGNLIYEARKELESEASGRVGGEITFQPKDDDDEEDERSFFSWAGLLWWAWYTATAMLVGFILVMIFGRQTRPLTESIGKEGPLGTLIGFFALIVVPVASVVAMLLVISLPLGVITLLLYLVALYVGKLPAALWLGNWLLARLGRADPSPYGALALGLVVLYMLFEIPYIGALCWVLATSLGLGSIVLAARARRQAQGDRPAEEL